MAERPGSGTKEKQKEVTINKYMRYRFNRFADGIRNPQKWELISEEVQEELKEAFGDDALQGYEIISAVAVFAKATGGLPKNKEERLALLHLIRPILQGPAAETTAQLCRFMKASQAMNLVDCYDKGKINPELAGILNDSYEMTEDLYKHNYAGPGMLRSGLIPYLIEEKKLDFSIFRGREDTGEEWFFNYRISTSPLPAATGHPAITLDRIKKGIEKEYVSAVSELKENVIRSLHGLKASEELLKSMKNVTADKDGYIRRPVEPEAFMQLAEAIETQYQRRQKERTRRDYAAPFTTEQEAGFYVNPITCKVHDLRPFTKDLHDLFSVKSWRYLKEFVAAIREAVTEFTGEELAKRKKEKPQAPSIFDKAFVKMINATPANELVNINTAVSGDTEKTNGIFEQNMFTQEWEYKKGGTELNYPAKHGDGSALLPLFTTSTWKTMHFISLLFTAQNSAKQASTVFPVVETNVREYMAATGRKVTVNNVKDVARTLKKDLETLSKISIKYNDRKYSLSRVNPFAETHIDRGKIRVALAPTFAEFLVKTTGFLMNYPAALLKLKESNSNIYPLGYKLALNRSNDTNIKRGKANILSVPVCLECCPGIPSIEKVRKGGRSPADRIIEPFEKALDALQQQGVLERWEYCLPKGEPLGQPVVTDYNYFISLYILYEIKDFPIGEELPRIQATAEKRQKRKERIERYTDQAIAKQRAKEATT